MNIQAQKLEILKLVLNTDNPLILRKIKSLFTKGKDFWDDLTEPEQEEILRGIEELDNGDAFSYDEVLKKYR